MVEELYNFLFIKQTEQNCRKLYMYESVNVWNLKKLKISAPLWDQGTGQAQLWSRLNRLLQFYVLPDWVPGEMYPMLRRGWSYSSHDFEMSCLLFYLFLCLSCIQLCQLEIVDIWGEKNELANYAFCRPDSIIKELGPRTSYLRNLGLESYPAKNNGYGMNVI